MKTSVLTAVFIAALTACTAQDTPGAPTQGAPTTQAGDMPMAEPAAAGTHATATGTVESIDAAAGKIVIAHGPIAAVGWPAMTMGFRATPEQIQSVQIGGRIEFEFETRGAEATLIRVAPEPGQ
jgi:Cu(I)/Ag(I) efflux system protein CusF